MKELLKNLQAQLEGLEKEYNYIDLYLRKVVNKRHLKILEIEEIDTQIECEIKNKKEIKEKILSIDLEIESFKKIIKK